MRAFSLVELSIVLVILGLLTGGILAGQSLIRAAELRAVAGEYQRYTAAIYSFRDRYMALPGDMRNATRFWNRQASDSWCVTNSAATISASGVCDGDGDGQIGESADVSQSGEGWQVWRHLAAAGLIEGGYTGLASASSAKEPAYGSNAPQSRLSAMGWFADHWNCNYVHTVIFSPFDYGNYVLFSATSDGKRLTPQELWNLDTKVDDGKPGRGRLMSSRYGSTCTDASASDDFDADYAVTYEGKDCGFYLPKAL